MICIVEAGWCCWLALGRGYFDVQLEPPSAGDGGGEQAASGELWVETHRDNILS